MEFTYAHTDHLGVLESVKAAAEYGSPLIGTVAEVNTALEDEPELINKNPYEQGTTGLLGSYLPFTKYFSARM